MAFNFLGYSIEKMPKPAPKPKAAKPKAKKAKAKTKAKKKKMETSKKLAWWSVGIATLTTIASYVLAYFDHQSVETLSATVFTACVTYLVAYATKSLGEKISRNRHGLDADGNPYTTPVIEGEEDHP